MNKRVVILLLALGAWPCLGHAQGWPVTVAPFRVIVQKTGAAPAGARVGWALVWTGDLDPVKCSVYVTATNGAAVGSKILWAAPHEPLKVLFDISGGDNTYAIYISPSAPPPVTAIEPVAGVVLETRVKPPGPADTWAQVHDLWTRATVVQGRSVLQNLYQGHNPHGPSSGFLAAYRGTLHIVQAGEYSFATISGDASFLFVDGKLIAQWPDNHGPWAGRHGQFKGNVHLEVGPHAFEYYHAPVDNEPLAEAVWRPPGRDRYEVIPPRLFGAVSLFESVAYAPAPANAAGAYGEWRPVSQATAQGLSLVNMRFRVPGADKDRECRWTFDDGAAATGPVVEHLFARPGLRQVKLEIRTAGQPAASLTTTVNVRPNWEQREEWPADIAQKQKEALLARDLASLPVPDIAYLVRYASAIVDHALLQQLGAAAWKRQPDFTAAGAEIFFALARHYQNADVRDYVEAERAYRALLGFFEVEPALRERARLRLAELLTRWLGRADDAAPLLDGPAADTLSGDEKRLRIILQADVALARGDVDAARRGYESVSTQSPARDPQAVVRRRARLESAQAWLARGAYDDAERVLREVVWEAPVEQLSLETGLALLKVHLARKEYGMALTRCRALLRVASSDTDRAELLYDDIEINQAMGRTAAARESLAALLKDHPYTEFAARAKDKWSDLQKKP